MLEMKLHPINVAIIVIYVAASVLLGLLVSKRASRDAKAYFLGGNTLPKSDIPDGLSGHVAAPLQCHHLRRMDPHALRHVRLLLLLHNPHAAGGGMPTDSAS
ncbi:MAG: hypothetical protein ABSG65_15510 [Bryobacteraceae bacterium]